LLGHGANSGALAGSLTAPEGKGEGVGLADALRLPGAIRSVPVAQGRPPKKPWAGRRKEATAMVSG
jgi:hypothetical protein